MFVLSVCEFTYQIRLCNCRSGQNEITESDEDMRGFGLLLSGTKIFLFLGGTG